MIKKLHELRSGECGTVISLTPEVSNMESRLRALGFMGGERVSKTMESPLGDPSAYLIKGSVIALRSHDAAGILIRPEVRDES